MYVCFLKSCLHGKRKLKMVQGGDDYTWMGYVCFYGYVCFTKKVVSKLSKVVSLISRTRSTGTYAIGGIYTIARIFLIAKAN